jgi:16S rRNA G527 N7-methylase RsmG
LGRLRDTVRLSMPLLKTDGLLVAYKGRAVRKEVEEILPSKEYQIKDVVKIRLQDLALLRNLVVIKRVG